MYVCMYVCEADYKWTVCSGGRKWKSLSYLQQAGAEETRTDYQDSRSLSRYELCFSGYEFLHTNIW